MPIEPRTEQFVMRISPNDLAMLRALAEHAGLASADIVRTCIRHEYREKFGDRVPKPKR